MDLICPSCQKRLSLEDRFAGLTVRCPMCNGMFQAPALAGAAAATSPAAAPPPIPMMPALELPSSGPARSEPAPHEPARSLPPPVPEPMPLPEAAIEPIDTPVVVAGDYTKSRTLHLRAEVLAWFPPVCVTLIFLLSFFPWYWRDLRLDNLWQMAFGDNLNASYTFYVVVLVIIAWPLSILTFAFEQGWLPLPPALRPLWPWRSAFVGAAILLPFVFFTFDYFGSQFDAHGNPATLARKLAYRVHLVAVLACILQFWLEQRRPANLPPPKIELRWQRPEEFPQTADPFSARAAPCER